MVYRLQKWNSNAQTAGVKSINCAAPNADWTVISNCAELTLIPAQSFPVGFSCAELTLIPAQSFPVGFSCAEKLYNSAHENPTGIVWKWLCRN